jgi:hypothetical protein
VAQDLKREVSEVIPQSFRECLSNLPSKIFVKVHQITSGRMRCAITGFIRSSSMYLRDHYIVLTCHDFVDDSCPGSRLKLHPRRTFWGYMPFTVARVGMPHDRFAEAKESSHVRIETNVNPEPAW